MIYKGKDLKDFSDWELELATHELVEAEKKREQASKHVKFNEDRIVNGNKVPKMDFPAPNPEYLKLKKAIMGEFENRKK